MPRMSPSNYLRLVTLRLRSSWTHWLQTRQERKLRRERERLLLLQRLMEEQALRVGRLVMEQHRRLEERQLLEPPLVTPKMEVPVPTETRTLLTPGKPEPMEELEPNSNPEQEIAQLLGLPPLQT